MEAILQGAEAEALQALLEQRTDLNKARAGAGRPRRLGDSEIKLTKDGCVLTRLEEKPKGDGCKLH